MGRGRRQRLDGVPTTGDNTGLSEWAWSLRDGQGHGNLRLALVWLAYPCCWPGLMSPDSCSGDWLRRRSTTHETPVCQWCPALRNND